jgi:hypothetical protein
MMIRIPELNNKRYILEHMICPQCRAEYREGFDRCADCGVPLVVELTAEEEHDEESTNELISMLETEDASFLADAVAAIEEAKIPYLIQSGTALDLESLISSDSLVWRAVLYAPSQLRQQVETLLAKVKSELENSPKDDESD